MVISRKALCLTIAVIASLLMWTPWARAVPTLDLTMEGAHGYINGAYFTVADPTGTGSGHIDSFVRIQYNGTPEEGYNTDGTLEFQTKSGAHTHSLLLTNVPVVQIEGVDCREFLLDIDEPGTVSDAGRLLSLDSMQIFLADSGSLTGYPSLGTKIFDLDPVGADNWILLDATLRSGSGSGDMFAYIPNSLFNPSLGSYVYLYSKFGVNNANNGGPDEWAVRTPTGEPPVPPIPAPGAVLLVLLGGNLAVSLHRRRMI